jgi:hypothetical protein
MVGMDGGEEQFNAGEPNELEHLFRGENAVHPFRAWHVGCWLIVDSMKVSMHVSEFAIGHQSRQFVNGFAEVFIKVAAKDDMCQRGCCKLDTP